MRRFYLLGVAVLLLMVSAHSAVSQEEAAASAVALAPTAVDLDQLLEDIRNPLPWVQFGGDARVRQTYQKNAFDLETEHESNTATDDTQHFFRVRARIWALLGPFHVFRHTDSVDVLTFYIRLTGEPRIWLERQAGTEAGNLDEVVFDNLYVDWTRIDGRPFSVRAGRQDLLYGRGFVIFNGTPLDTDRTLYSDAIRGRWHVDSLDGTVDVFYVDNKARQTRIRPFNEQGRLVHENDLSLLGVYANTKKLRNQSWDAYLLYKDENNHRSYPTSYNCHGPSAPAPVTRLVRTAGVLLSGTLYRKIEYYLEHAWQWGKEGHYRRKGYGFTGDVRYTWLDAQCQPWVWVGYEYLSGDDPDTKTFEGWDPVMGRWPRWSWVQFYEWTREESLTGYFTNLQRASIGCGARPNDKTKAELILSYLLANEQTHHPVPIAPDGFYDNGWCRGGLIQTKLERVFNEHLTGQVLVEYFWPGGYYGDRTDYALFLRWALMWVY